MTDHANAVLVRAAIEAFNGGDLPAMLDWLDDDIVWHAPGTSRFGGRFEGKDAVVDRFRRMSEAGVAASFVIHDVIGNDEHVVALVQAAIVAADGRRYETPQVQVSHIRDGRCVEYWSMNQDQAAMDVVLDA